VRILGSGWTIQVFIGTILSLCFAISYAPDSEAQTEDEMKPYGEVLSDTGVTLHVVPIPGGRFVMGSAAEEWGQSKSEGP